LDRRSRLRLRPPPGNLNPEESFCYQIDRVVLFQSGFFHGAGQGAAFLQEDRIAGGFGLTCRFIFLDLFNGSVKNGPRTV